MLGFLVLLLLVSNVVCFTPNCVPENQFKFYRFPVEGCSENFNGKCKSHPSGYFKALGDASLVKIGITDVIPTCAFYSAETLKNIYAVNSKIKVIATGAFRNLPNLEGIYMAFNSITELRKDVFQNVSLEMLDLSWNKLVFVDPHALDGIRGLKNLNLSTNSLMTVSINSLPPTISYINLGHNLLGRVALNSNKYTNLTVVDLSNNLIEKIAVLVAYPVDEIDLTNNRLQDFDYVEIPSVKIFRIGRNQFENVPKYMENLNTKEIDLYPNPWKCDQLFLLWETLVSFNIRLAPRAAGKNPPAECFTTGGNLGLVSTRSTPCLEDHECPDHMVCRTKKCWDPCENALCHESSSCETRNHQFMCSCQNNLHLDPLDIKGKCQKVDCFTDLNCQSGSVCWDNKCKQLTVRPDIVSTTTQGSPFGGNPSGGSAAAAYPGGSFHQRPITEGNDDEFFAGDFNAHFRPINVDGNIDVTAGLPWWFEDIPKLYPDLSNVTKGTVKQ